MGEEYLLINLLWALIFFFIVLAFINWIKNSNRLENRWNSYMESLHIKLLRDVCTDKGIDVRKEFLDEWTLKPSRSKLSSRIEDEMVEKMFPNKKSK